MSVHIVEQGECLSSLAARYGLAGWEELHEDPANAELKKKRPNPNILAPGDEVVVPDSPPLKTVPAATGRIHIFQVNLRKIRLRIAVVDRSGKPYQGKRFVVNVGAREIGGTTASTGMVEVEVPVTESKARLRVWLWDDGADAPPTIDRNLAIGHVDPIDTLSGVRGRLSNLAYPCPISDAPVVDPDDQTLAAVRSFRARNGLPDIDRPGPKDVQGDTQGDDPGATSDENDESASDSGAQPEANAPTEEEIAKYVEQLIDDAFREKLLTSYSAGAGA